MVISADKSLKGLLNLELHSVVGAYAYIYLIHRDSNKIHSNYKYLNTKDVIVKKTFSVPTDYKFIIHYSINSAHIGGNSWVSLTSWVGKAQFEMAD